MVRGILSQIRGAGSAENQCSCHILQIMKTPVPTFLHQYDIMTFMEKEQTIQHVFSEISIIRAGSQGVFTDFP